jgi:hypothetical protein
MRANRPGEPQGAATARAPYDKPASISAPLFRTLIEQLPEDRRWVILDIGAAHPATLELLNGYRCRLDIADLTEDVERLADGVGGEASGAGLTLMEMRNPEPADIVFCWDFLNYLNADALAALMAQIAARCRAGALVHALIAYSERVMHTRPGQYLPVDAGTLLDSAKTAPTRIAPRYSTEALSQAMPDYTVERVRLLSNGMQEYLFKTRSLRDALGPAPELRPARPKVTRGTRKSSSGASPSR